VGEIQDKLSEKKDFDYSPLTDAQKEEMSDTDITNWENKAKEGILANDDNLEQLLNDLTSAFNSPVVDSSGNSVSTIYFGSIGDNALGIDTSDDYSEGAKLSITDEQKFTDALTNHADEIMKLFTTTSDSTDATDKFNQSGIFQRISDIIDKNVGVIGTTLNSGTLTKYANLQDDYSVTGGSGTGTLPDQIYQQQLLINTLTDRMNDDQTKYYNQFTQLEVAMEQLNAQQSTLSLYLG
jgi:flagellar hook-associated protein 2